MSDIVERAKDSLNTYEYSKAYGCDPMYPAGLVRAMLAEVERLRAEVERLRDDVATWEQNCDGGCDIEGAPMEQCSLHGRTPADLWSQLDIVCKQRDEALAEVERLRPREIRTVAELDALPAGSLINRGATCFRHIGSLLYPWREWDGLDHPSADIRLPALLLWTP